MARNARGTDPDGHHDRMSASAERWPRRPARAGRGALVAALAMSCVLAFAPQRASSTPPIVPLGPCGPIQRTHEAVELRGMRLRRLVGTPLERLGMIAWRDGRPEPIPFQVDERIASHLVMSVGGTLEEDDTPGILDEDDTVVFMACDAGQRAPSGTPPAAEGREIRIDDARTGATAWVYLVVSDTPPRSDRRYVRYDPAQDIVSTSRWRIGCVEALPSYFSLALSGVPGPNIVDGLRLRAEAVLRGNLVRWSISERDGRNGLVGWREGPIRVIRRSRHEVEIGLGIHLTAGILHSLFYAEHVLAPGSLKLPFSPSVFFREITAVGGVDLQGLEGWRYLAPGVAPPGLAIDGRMDGTEQGYAGRGRWFALTRPSEALLVAVTMSPELERALPLDLVYLDDATRTAPPELVPGSVPFVGLRARAVERLSAGRYRFQLRILALPGWEPGAEELRLREMDMPLSAAVSIPRDFPARSRPRNDRPEGP